MGGKSGGGGGQQGTSYNPQADMGGFNALLPAVTAGILSNQGSLGKVAGGLGNLANPSTWNNFTQQQLGQFDVQGNQMNQNTLGQLARQGITGTGAANALNQNAFQLNAQRNALTGQLGQQGLQFQGGVLGQIGNVLGEQNKMGSEALQNLLAPATVNTAATAASNAGVTPGKKGGK